MARPRKTNAHLPASVYLRSGVYWYVKKGKWHRLGVDLAASLAAYARLVDAPAGMMPSLIEDAWPTVSRDRRGKLLAASTLAQYRRAADELKELFKHYDPQSVTTGDVQVMMDTYRQIPAVANRMLVVLKKVFKHATKRQLVPVNPVIGADRWAQTPRDRLITPAEYRAIYEACTPRTQVIVELCARTGQRIGDVLAIKRSQLRPEGIAFAQQKTGARLVVEWTPELKAAVDRAKRLSPNPFSPQLFITRNGKVPNYQNVWRSFKAAARKAGVQNVTPHDLRAFAATTLDIEGGNAQAMLGHKDRRTTEIYLRSKVVPLVSGPRKVG